MIDPQQLFSLKGRTALVTGGSRGIGRMIAEGYVRSGARVYISARKAEACDATAKELSALGHCVSLPADVSTVEGANQALSVIDQAINTLNQQGGSLGAIQNRIQASVQNVQTTATNLQAAQSVVQDANIADATTQLSKYQILQQAGISTLATANSLQQSYLKQLP